MTKEKWQNILGQVKDSFLILEEGIENLEDEGGVEIEFIVFNGPLGKMRLEFITKPVLLDKKTTYSNRIGAETKIDYVYSDSEKTSKMIAYKWDENTSEWVEMESANFG